MLPPPFTATPPIDLGRSIKAGLTKSTHFSLQSMHSLSSSNNMMIRTVVALLVAGVYAVNARSPCAEGWRYFPVTNACYKLIDDELPWTIAEFKCLFQGAHHVSVDSAAENQFVHELARRGEMWTGAAWFGSTPDYVNSDQTPYGRYTNWKSGVTPSLNKARRCIKIGRDGQWFQSCCKKKSLAVCEKPAAYSWESSNDLSEFRRAKFRRLRF
ncbi:lectin C-type domain protein [Teladorsagia circumcincta]|uniref:Lectin C-type domain protein n=1 Tax=Teladorsagia circumcincta TaxID=45464 RepID=A0A2G9ULB7_TELCI|nr:lectin C-type domain protein [Teladorsagia circumcincta]